eukprot:gene13660-19547_t
MAPAKKISKGGFPSLKQPLADCLLMAMWAFCSSVFGEVAELLALNSNFDEFALNIVVLLLALVVVTWMCEGLKFFRGAIFNPLNSTALALSGKEPWMTSAVRMVGQLIGAFAGSMAAWYLVPLDYQGKFHMLAGSLKDGVDIGASVLKFHMLTGSLKDGVDIGAGVLTEALLGFFLSLIFLYCCDTKNQMIIFWLPLINTVINCVIGSYFTGPSLHPYLSFSWNFIYQRHSLEEHVIVFWLAPFVGAIAAGLLYSEISLAPKKLTSSRASKTPKLRPDVSTPGQAYTSGSTYLARAPAGAKKSKKSTKKRK